MDNFTPNELRHGLAQMLRTYASAGVKRFHRSSDVQIPAELLTGSVEQRAASAMEASTSRPAKTVSPSHQLPAASAVVAAQATASQAATPASVNVQPNLLEAPTPSTTARKERTSAAPLLQIAPGPWPLPSLPIENRQSMLSELKEQVVTCRKCEELVCYRRQTVFGEGHLQPRICFYGEAPGADEDAQGRPFVGAAGRLLGDIIRAMRLTREEVYILNSLKCRPPQNRTPLPEEVENCRTYGLTQLAILQPEFIILLGAVAARSVLQTSESVGRLRGRFHSYHSARVLVTYHPAYLLRNADAKKLVWADVQMVMREIGTLPKAT